MFSSFREFLISAHRRASDFMEALNARRRDEAERRSMSDSERVLDLLAHNVNRWVPRPYQKLSVMWHSRVADLRKKGHRIDCRCVKTGKERDYQYRLVVNPDGDAS
jgi:hypothetical protein